MTRARITQSSSRGSTSGAARGSLDRTPITIRSDTTLGSGFEQRIRSQVASRIGHAAGVVQRITVRFEDVNGPKGGVDTVCRIKAVLIRRPSIVVDKRAESHDTAFAQAVHALGTALDRTQGKHALRAAPQRRAAAPARARTRTQAPLVDDGELIGRRVGRGPAALARALARPEKRSRAAYVDTAAPGVSAADRRAGGTSTARRNTLARTTRATATLEDSRTKPSRKSTRRSANRGKPSQTKERAAVAQLVTPSARATRRR